MIDPFGMETSKLLYRATIEREEVTSMVTGHLVSSGYLTQEHIDTFFQHRDDLPIKVHVVMRSDGSFVCEIRDHSK